MPVPALRRVDIGYGTHQAHLGTGGNRPDGGADGPGGREHGLPGHIQPDLPVGMGLAGLQNPCQEFFPGQLLAGPLAVDPHVLLTEAAAPDQRVMVVEPEVILHPQNGGVQPGVAGIDIADVILPVFAQGADAQVGPVAPDVHHGTEMLVGSEVLAQIGMHHAVPVVDGDGDALAGHQLPDLLHHGKINILLLKAHVSGVDLLHVGENGNVVDDGFVYIAVQCLDLLGIVEAGIAAEPESILKGILCHGPDLLVRVFRWGCCRRTAWRCACSRRGRRCRGLSAMRRGAGDSGPGDAQR